MKSFLKLPPQFRNGYKDKKRLGLVATVGCIVCKTFGLKCKGRLEIHHFIGCGIGKKSSDLLTFGLCLYRHTGGSRGEAIHSGKDEFEEKFGTQEDLLKLVNKELGTEKEFEEYFKIIELNK